MVTRRFAADVLGGLPAGIALAGSGMRDARWVVNDEATPCIGDRFFQRHRLLPSRQRGAGWGLVGGFLLLD